MCVWLSNILPYIYIYISPYFPYPFFYWGHLGCFNAFVSYPKPVVFCLNEKTWREIILFNQCHWGGFSGIMLKSDVGSGFIKKQKKWLLPEKLICLSIVQCSTVSFLIRCHVSIGWWNVHVCDLVEVNIYYLYFLYITLFFSFGMKFSKVSL